MSKLTNIQQSSSGNMNSVALMVAARQSFFQLCEELIVKAYNKLLSRNIHQLTWEEDHYSGNIKDIIDQMCNADGYPLYIIYQDYQLTPAILAGTSTAKSAKRMDLVFTSFDTPRGLKYGMEAKIMSSENIGTRNAKTLSKEYVLEGMDRFLNGSYNMTGCMLSYVIAGCESDTVTLVNQALANSSRGSETLRDQHLVQGHFHCYRSYHPSGTLKHILLLFI